MSGDSSRYLVDSFQIFGLGVLTINPEPASEVFVSIKPLLGRHSPVCPGGGCVPVSTVEILMDLLEDQENAVQAIAVHLSLGQTSPLFSSKQCCS